ncbi:hypothetical protein Dthio_PD0730 [Desulfonatronospira thiodismutans ASO3-1]|uniref:CopG domain protein DNA-binding domain protein n=1 Tax=Desulfonatronospira thiodismutans ASO3-1 TaxID=555779 RepID=D6SRT3_9BACT|nr:DUF6364 family protein [Desulfonatronospira thiodismutans]EFI33399.1 hypothetical protein Dthio_PD0730 [Desulfonatronospira thiodismutans ASO3-1]
MNITLSADKELIQKAREYAAQRGTSLNQLIREYLEHTAAMGDKESNAREFERLARECGGTSPKGYVFDREDAHGRGEDGP